MTLEQTNYFSKEHAWFVVQNCMAYSIENVCDIHAALIQNYRP